MARLSRAVRVFKYWPREALKRWPEQTVLICTTTVAATGVFLYKLFFMDPFNVRPWHRGKYDVVRPESEIASLWRVPEDYPAPYDTNRQANSYWTAKKDYGHKLSV